MADQARSSPGRYRGEMAARAQQLDPAQRLDLVCGSHSEPSRLGLVGRRETGQSRGTASNAIGKAALDELRHLDDDESC